METESTPTRSSRRPRTSLLILLGIVLAAAAMLMLREDSAAPAAPTSNPGRPQQPARGNAFQPERLDVRIEALSRDAAQPGDTERNPFRFQPKAPPPRPEPPPGKRRDPDPAPVITPPAPSPVAAIPLKFIGVTEAPNVGKIAALTDCRHTVQGVEGDVVDGRYRIVKIGVESIVIEYVDGKGRTTLRMSGQDCVAK